MELKRFFGTDPEFFVYTKNIKTDYGNIPELIPPASLITDYHVKFSTNKNDKRVLVDYDDFRFIEDGAALELNFKKPVNDVTQFIYLFQSAVDYMKRRLYNMGNFSLSDNVLGYFDTNKYWKNRDKSFTDCVRFGCDPDVFPKLYILNGFEKEECKIIDASSHEYRYAGGHLHIQNMSNNSDIYYDNVEIAPIVFDFIVGTSNILSEKDKNIVIQEKARLNYYGRPGRIRLQQYSDTVNGIEYRPPSNQWLFDSYSVNRILSSANIAAIIVENGGARLFFKTFKDRISTMWDTLTTYNIKEAKSILIDSLSWALENHFITLNDFEGVFDEL